MQQKLKLKQKTKHECFWDIKQNELHYYKQKKQLNEIQTCLIEAEDSSVL